MQVNKDHKENQLPQGRMPFLNIQNYLYLNYVALSDFQVLVIHDSFIVVILVLLLLALF